MTTAITGLLKDLLSKRLIAFHQQCLDDSQWPTHNLVETSSGIWREIANNHFHNSSLWDEEDQARRTDVSDTEIANNKRNIDRFNQARNDAIEAINEIILGVLSNVKLAANAWLNSETAGSIMDRLSILSLKIKAMTFQRDQQTKNPERSQELQLKLQQLETQRHDLAMSLDRLLHGFAQGTAYFKQYRQHKMYNDPTLNPYLNGTYRQ